MPRSHSQGLTGDFFQKLAAKHIREQTQVRLLPLVGARGENMTSNKSIFTISPIAHQHPSVHDGYCLKIFSINRVRENEQTFHESN